MDETQEQQMIAAIRRQQIKDQLRQASEQILDARADRHLEIDHQGIIGNHHFAAASSECINVYCDGHYISAVMASQAVNEGIIKFIAERNGIARHITQPQSRLKAFFRRLFRCSVPPTAKTKSLEELVEEFVRTGILSTVAGEAAKRILGSFRNDVHHMNPKVASIPFSDLAKRNLQDLAAIEREIFEVDFDNGRLLPKQPKYWDIQQTGTVPVFLRLGT
jgi:hypothetical protein